MPQATVARIERGVITPRVDSLERLLLVCGRTLEAEPILGVGVDRTLIRERMALSPVERSQRATDEGRALLRLLARRSG